MLKPAWGGRGYAPHFFTEHSTIMAAMVLSSPGATEISAYVVRAFVQLRESAMAKKELARRLDALDHASSESCLRTTSA